MQDDFELAENERLKKDIKHLAATAREKAEWSDRAEATKIGTHQADRGYIGHKAAKMMKRSKAIEKRRQNAVEEKSSLLKNIEEYENLKIHPLEFHSKRLCEFDGVSVYYGGRKAVGEIDLQICRGDRIFLDGANGSGKSTLIKLILGEKLDYSGDFYLAPGLKISYVPQDVSSLSGSLDEFESRAGVDRVLFRAILRKLDFERETFERPLETYSEGQKKKAVIARSLAESAHLYIWDEPLNYIDIYSRIQIERLLAGSDAAMLLVEHDRAFRDTVATATLEL